MKLAFLCRSHAADPSARILLLGWAIGMILAAPLAAMPPQPVPGRNPGRTTMREITEQGYRVQLDLSTQVLRLHIPEDRGFAEGSVGKQEAPISPVLSELSGDRFISASVLAQKAKQFDDGFYAAIDLAAQQGAGRFQGKAALLTALAQALGKQADASVGTAPATVLAAGKLGKLNIDIPAAARKTVEQLTEEFLGDPLRSKPIAFYTWTSELSAIFQQDRILQSELKDKSGTEAVVRALASETQTRATYDAYLNLVSRLTNPLAYPDLRKPLAGLDQGKLDVPAKGIYFFPPSRSHETELVKKLYGNQPIPEGFSLVDEMIRRIRSGQLTLLPTPESGWYDYQTWALEPLVIPEKMPEARRLNLDETYRRQLLDLFKGILALTRETHIKQLEIPMVGAAAPRPEVVVRVYPELSAEPLAAYYFRRAWSYHFVGWAVEQTFGETALASMHRLTAAGPVEPTLRDELRTMEGLFYGAHVTICRQLGEPPVKSPEIGSGQGTPADEAPFAAWRSRLGTDADVGQDSRMMVPLFYDVERKKTKVWAFLGWSRRPLEVAFDKAPTAVVFDPSGRRVTQGGPRLEFDSMGYTLAYPVTAEVYVTEILNRDEFRRLCDRFKTRSAILANLR